MEALGVIYDLAKNCVRYTKAQAAYVFDLQKNLESLNKIWGELQNKEKDVQTKIDRAESTGVMKKTNEVNGWLQEFQKLQENMMKDIPNSQEVGSNQCLNGYCPKNCVSSYKLGKKIVKRLNEANDMLSKADNMQIAIVQPPKPVDEIPCSETIGLDLLVNSIWNTLQDDNVGIIGLLGMGGVGKTTLLKIIHNELGKREHSFDIVLWVVVSKDFDINKIMTDIRSRLGIDDGFWNRSSQDQKIAKIYERLKDKKFVLMLDDLWGKLELEAIGVPLPKESNNKSKVVFTTRSVDVCAKMKAQRKVEVKCLSEKEAFDLFCDKVGEETLRCHTEILEIAHEMSNECGGLPLALVTVGSAMAGVESLEAWMVAKRDLKSYPLIASDLEDRVFRILEYSYDRLPNEAHKLCFLYCAIYPDDFEVDVDEVIDRWIAEGFLGEYDTSSVYDMYEQGKSIMEKLILACLLQESVDSNSNNSLFCNRMIKMHDVIRDMALWLAREKNGNRDKIVVQGEAFSMSEMDSKRLNDVKRISIILGTEDSLKSWQVPACPNLETLCVRLKVDATNLLSNLQFLKSLRVLDLCNVSIKTLSPEIGELINLEFINISNTFLHCLPIEMKKLKNLRVLLMDNMGSRYVVNVIHLEVIESLERLKVLRFSRASVAVPYHGEIDISLLEKLESLPKLDLFTVTSMHKLLESTKLRGCCRHFKIYYPSYTEVSYGIEMSSLLAFMSEMKHLDYIQLLRVHNLLDVSPVVSDNKRCHLAKLCHVHINGCSSITHLTWLRYAPLLKILDVASCGSIEHIVKDDNEEADSKSNNDINIFANLKKLRLVSMPMLASIHKRSLPFPSLKYIAVRNCPVLRKLPFSSRFASNYNLIAIQGEDYWWESLNWDDTTIKNLLHSKFSPIVV